LFFCTDEGVKDSNAHRQVSCGGVRVLANFLAVLEHENGGGAIGEWKPPKQPLEKRAEVLELRKERAGSCLLPAMC
jgi:hypothetical protein